MQNSVEIGLEIEAFSDDGYQNVDRDGDPDLGFDGVLGGGEELSWTQLLGQPAAILKWQAADIRPFAGTASFYNTPDRVFVDPLPDVF